MNEQKKLSFDEIVKVLAEFNVTPEKFGELRWDLKYERESVKQLEDRLGKIELADEYGGEGEGSTYYVVVKFVDHDVYIKVDAYYESYDGTDWDSSEFVQVKPKEVAKVEWVKA